MKTSHLLVLVTATLMAAGSVAFGQSSETPVTSEAPPGSVPIDQIAAIVAKKTGKRFVLDPRVRANVVLIGGAPSDLTYSEFLTVLDVYGYGAVENGRYVRIVPSAGLRTQAVPTITAKDTRPGSEFVTEIVNVRNLSAQQLVPILRPMMNQDGHLAAYPSSNTLILSDRFDNVRRLESIIRSLDAEKPRVGTENNEPNGAAAR